jgi:peptide/nickel transport system permease protein
MKDYLVYLLTRLGQFALVVFIGVNIAFIVTHATPIDPVEQSIAAATQYGSTSPEAIALMRQSLRELYGLEGGLGEQYLAFWRRVAVGDFGPSLSAFPTPSRARSHGSSACCGPARAQRPHTRRTSHRR